VVLLQFKALIKGFAFRPQVVMGCPPLDEGDTEKVIASAIEVFLAAYET